MKNTNIKNLILIILLFGFGISSIKLQGQNLANLNGIFEGVHVEYNAENPRDSFVYFYKFELEQDSHKVVGKSYIYNNDGYYAVVSIRGLILENQFFFEEFQTIDEINPKNNPWCFTSGHLDIVLEKDKTWLKGNTKSYTKKYSTFCRTGFSSLSRINPLSPLEETTNNTFIPKISELSIHPNPIQGALRIDFNISNEAFIVLEIYDLEGELIVEVVKRNLSAGAYSFEADLSFKDDGMYVVELIVDRKLYSTEIWKSRK